MSGFLRPPQETPPGIVLSSNETYVSLKYHCYKLHMHEKAKENSNKFTYK